LTIKAAASCAEKWVICFEIVVIVDSFVVCAIVTIIVVEEPELWLANRNATDLGR
jgi:hypothetical protein